MDNPLGLHYQGYYFSSLDKLIIACVLVVLPLCLICYYINKGKYIEAHIKDEGLKVYLLFILTIVKILAVVGMLIVIPFKFVFTISTIAIKSIIKLLNYKIN